MDVFHVDFINFASLGPIEGIEKITWVERYNQPGEFIIIGDPVPLATNLPIGRFISHSGTDNVMVVESHFIDESEDSEYPKKLQVKGTCITNYIMQNRVVHRYPPTGEEEAFWSYSEYYEFARKAAYYETGPVTINIVQLILNLLNHHLTESYGLNESIENLINLSYGIESDNAFGNYVTDKLPYLNKAVYKILLEADIGLKAFRPGPRRAYLEDPDFISIFYSGLNDPKEMLFFLIHAGTDLSDSVIFDINNGDVHNARYLWTNKHDKNAFYSGNEEYVQRWFSDDLGTLGGWSRKVARVDLQDYIPLDTVDYDTLIWTALNERGREAIRLAQSQGIIIDALGTRNSGPKYGVHYQVGDVVRVIGNYGVNQNMRVSEVAFTQDKDVEFIVPTFKPVYIVPHTPPS